MSEKFEIEVTDYGYMGGMHFYGRVNIPTSRQVESYSPRYYHELSRPSDGEAPKWWTKEDGSWTTIKFWDIAGVILAAKKWFLADPRVKPGDKLVINKEDWLRRHKNL